MIVSYLSDKWKVRSPFIFFGLAILISVHGASHFSAEYGAICLIAMGSFGIGGIIVCWYIMNLRGHIERSIGSAWMICFGNCGGIVATFIFLKKDKPYYHSGYSICLAMAALCVASAAFYLTLIWRERKAEFQNREENKTGQHELYL